MLSIVFLAFIFIVPPFFGVIGTRMERRRAEAELKSRGSLPTLEENPPFGSFFSLAAFLWLFFSSINAIDAFANKIWELSTWIAEGDAAAAIGFAVMAATFATWAYLDSYVRIRKFFERGLGIPTEEELVERYAGQQKPDASSSATFALEKGDE